MHILIGAMKFDYILNSSLLHTSSKQIKYKIDRNWYRISKSISMPKLSSQLDDDLKRFAQKVGTQRGNMCTLT